MTHFNSDIYPVKRITAGAVGDLGRRTFLLQAHMNGQVVCWVIEKEQALALSRTIPRLLADVQSEYPELADPLVAERPMLHLIEPLRPAFQVETIRLSYVRSHDLVELILTEQVEEEEEDLLNADEEDGALHIYATRGQVLILSRQVEDVVAAGRPYCPHCGEPMDDFGHFCQTTPTHGRRGETYVQ